MNNTTITVLDKHINYIVTTFSLGYIIIAKTAKGVCAIYFDSNPETLIQNLNK